MANVYQKSVFAAAGAGVALGCTVIGANPAAATVFNVDFTVTVTEGSLVGNQYLGSFKYDDTSVLVPISDISTGGFSFFDFTFAFEGKTYNDSDLLIGAGGYGGFYPDLEEGGGLETASPGVGIGGFMDDNEIIFLTASYSPELGKPIFFGYSDCKDELFITCEEAFGTVQYEVSPSTSSTSIPEPGTAGGLVVLGLGSLLFKKKTVSSKRES